MERAEEVSAECAVCTDKSRQEITKKNRIKTHPELGNDFIFIFRFTHTLRKAPRILNQFNCASFCTKIVIFQQVFQCLEKSDFKVLPAGPGEEMFKEDGAGDGVVEGVVSFAGRTDFADTAFQTKSGN